MSRSLRLPLILTLCVLFLPTPVSAQDDEAFRLGTHVLRLLMHHRKLKPLPRWESLADNPDNTILVLLGSPTDRQGNDLLARVPGGVFNFIRAGGAVLVATDYQLESPDLVHLSGHWPLGGRVSAWPPEGVRVPDPERRLETRIDDGFVYRRRQDGLQDCIIVNPNPDVEPPLFWNTLGQRKQALRVVTNRSGYLGFSPDFLHPGVKVLARFPPGCWYRNRGFLPKNTKTLPAFAVSAETGTGRLLMLADHSVLINEMLVQEDNNNLDFAFNALEWLSDGKRTDVLFVEDGEIQTQFNVRLRQEVKPLRELQRRIAEESRFLVKQMQEKQLKTNYLNYEAVDLMNEVPGRFLFGQKSGENFFKMMLLLAGIVGAVFGFSRLVRASHRGEPGVPLFASIVGRHRPIVSPLLQRQRSALSGDDLREFGREAVREWFATLPGCPHDEAGRHPPRVEASGGWWHARKLRLEVLDLWRLASGADTPPLTHNSFRRLLNRLERLRAAVEAGEIRISW